jgi:aspartokinase
MDTVTSLFKGLDSHSSSLQVVLPSTKQETVFEKQRGINSLEIRKGFAQVCVHSLPEPLHKSRLHVLRCVKEAGISIDFLKLTLSGFSFVVSREAVPQLESVLSQSMGDFCIQDGRSTVLVHAVNMRDEEGLIARIVSCAIANGVQIDHLGDMHDRLLLVTSDPQAELLSEVLHRELMGVAQ